MQPNLLQPWEKEWKDKQRNLLPKHKKIGSFAVMARTYLLRSYFSIPNMFSGIFFLALGYIFSFLSTQKPEWRPDIFGNDLYVLPKLPCPIAAIYTHSSRNSLTSWQNSGDYSLRLSWYEWLAVCISRMKVWTYADTMAYETTSAACGIYLLLIQMCYIRICVSAMWEVPLPINRQT